MEEEEAAVSSTKSGNEDRISSLPDELISHILFFLPTKYAVGTSILSTRWRYLWTSVPVLNFDDTLILAPSTSSAHSSRKRKSFLHFVDRVLTVNTVQSIHRFSLRFSSANRNDSSHVNKWICNALMRNLVEIYLSLHHCYLPQTFFVSDKLVVLKLQHLTALNVPDHVSFPILKVLHLRFLSCLDAASTRKLLSASPCLEKLLVVRNWSDNVLRLHLHSCTLKSLTISGRFQLLVDAPNLEFLHHSATMNAFWLPQSFFSSVKLMILKLELNIVLDVPDDVFFPSLKILHLRCLEHLDDAIMRKLLSASRALEKLVISRCYHHGVLTLHVHSCTLKSLTINGSFELLVDAPNLEFLELKYYISKDLNIMGLTSLVKAVFGANDKNAITTFDDYVEMVGFLRRISHVKVLCLSGFLMTTLEETCAKHPDAFNGWPTFHNLTHLKVESVLSGYSVVPYILECTPNLKVLVLDIPDDPNHAPPFNQKLIPPKFLPQCFSSCLGMVEFRKFLASETEMEIVAYLLKNAMVLTKMTISYGSASRDPVSLLDILKNFSRASDSCQIFVS